jgi:tRNA(Ile2) C34 agmatinyltransferase TiaS
MVPPTLVGSEAICDCGTRFIHEGRGPRCRECSNTLQRERRAKDPERSRAYHREWDRKNPDKVKAKRDKHQATPGYAERLRTSSDVRSDRSRIYYQDNREKMLESAAKSKIMSYGITVEQFNEMLERQNGVCAICGEDNSRFGKRLAIDHDHDTGVVRGLLCNSCNGALGLFKDDEATLLKALDYIQKGRG